jgi:iron complex transport system substrate-binding protein
VNESGLAASGASLEASPGNHDPYPKRIVCLTEESTEILYRIGQADRIVGISGFTVRPPEARKEKPKVSAFLSAKIDQILALKPDLAIGFSDIQADIARALIAAGVEVWVSNHRSVQGILDYTVRLASWVGAHAAGAQLLAQMQQSIAAARALAATFKRRPRVYFEEWDNPRISGIQWVCELIRIAGGDDIFPELAAQSLGKHRILADDSSIFARQPELILASWCGKKFRPEMVRARPGWSELPAVRDDELHELKSALILQPGPAAILDALPIMSRLFQRWQRL